MQFEFQGHPQEVDKESLGERRSGKGQWKCGETRGVCATISLHLSSFVFRVKSRGSGSGDLEQQRREVLHKTGSS